MPTRTPNLSTIFATALLFAALPASAQWTGKGEAGLAIANGNSSSRTANAKLDLARKVEKWEHGVGLSGLYVRADGDTTAERWEARAQSRFDFAARTFWFAGLRYEEDRFSGFDHQGLATTGIGRRFIEDEVTRLIAQVGVGYKFWETLGAPADKDNRVTGVANVDFTQQLTGTTSVFDRLAGEFASGNNFLRNAIGVAVKMSDRLALALAYLVRHNTNPPDGFKKTDSLSTVNLVYEVR